jgi:hypothetical protein
VVLSGERESKMAKFYEVTVRVPKSEIEEGICTYLENVFENFSQEAIDRADLPSEIKMINQLLSNEKFISAFLNEIRDDIQSDINVDGVAYLAGDLPDSFVSDIVKACSKAEEELSREEEAARLAEAKKAQEKAEADRTKREAADLKRTIKALEMAGYKVVKA